MSNRYKLIVPFNVENWEVPAGELGTLEVDKYGDTWLHLDRHIDGLEEWDNRLFFGVQNAASFAEYESFDVTEYCVAIP